MVVTLQMFAKMNEQEKLQTDAQHSPLTLRHQGAVLLFRIIFYTKTTTDKAIVLDSGPGQLTLSDSCNLVEFHSLSYEMQKWMK